MNNNVELCSDLAVSQCGSMLSYALIGCFTVRLISVAHTAAYFNTFSHSYSFASIGMRETVTAVETGEKRLGNSEYWPIVRTVVVIIIKKIMYCSRKVFCLFTQARTDWQLPLAEPLPITCIDQSFRHGRLWVTSPPNTNTPHSIVPPPHIDWQLSVKT